MRKLRRALAVLIAALAFLVLFAGSDALLGVAQALPHHLTISPNGVTVPSGATQTLTVSGASSCCIFNWTFVKNVSGATLHGAGPFRALYTAGTIQGTDTIQVTLPNGDSASATVTVSTIGVSPPTATLPPRGTQTFTASGGSGPSYTWDFVVNNSGGSLSADGVYVAGPTGSVIDTIRVTDSAGHSAQLSATVTSAVTLTPPSAALLPLGSLTFTASGGSGGGFAWTLSTNGSSGAVTQDGVYTAGSTNNTHDVVTVTDSLGNVASATVTVGSPAPLTIRPSDVAVPVRTQVALFPGGGSSPYRWAVETNASGGHVNRNGGFPCRYFCWVTGGTAGGTDGIRVTDALGATARANVRVGALTISPQDVVLLVQGSKQFIASGGSDGGYTWTLSTNASEGSIDPVTGWYTAGTVAPTTDVVRVTDSDGGSAEAHAHVILPPMLVASPSTWTLPPRGSVDFTASGGSGAGYTWAFLDNPSGGTLSTAGAYTAGATGDVTDVIRLTDSLSHSIEATVNVTAALRLSPETWSLAPRESKTFTVSGGSGTGNIWMLSTNRSGGTLTEGLYTAGATGGVTDVLRVTDSLGAFAEATIKVTTPPPPPGKGCGTTGGAALPALVLLLLPILARRRHRSIGTTPSNQSPLRRFLRRCVQSLYCLRA